MTMIAHAPRWRAALLLLLIAQGSVTASATETITSAAAIKRTPCVQAFAANENTQLMALCSSEAEQGSYIAAFLLANLLIADNPRLAKDPAEAYRLYARAAKLAAQAGPQPSAQWILGTLTIEGRGTRKDINFGLEQLWQAAKANYVPAFRQLGLIYSRGIELGRYTHGQDLRPDPAKAFQYFLRAGQRGDRIAQAQLAAAHKSGLGVPVNKVKAYAWYSVLAAGGDEEGRQQIQKLQTKLTPSQLAKAQAMSRQLLTAYGSGKGVYDY